MMLIIIVQTKEVNSNGYKHIPDRASLTLECGIGLFDWNVQR